MHKAGGIIALIAGIFAIFAIILTAFASLGSAVMSEAENAAAEAGATFGGELLGGIVMIAVVLILSIIILNTRTRWPGIVLALACFLAIGLNSAGGIVSACLAFALLGGLMSLNLGRTKQASM